MNDWLLLAAVVAAVLLIPRLLGGRKANMSTVLDRIKAGASIIDVRTPDEFRDGAYPGARNIPLQTLQGRLAEIPKDKPVVLYCASGARSGVGAMMLKKAGYADVVNAGGLDDMPR